MIAYVFSSTKLDKRAEHVPPDSQGCGREREGAGARERNGLNNLCTYE
jgi:hypothetical protein